MCLLSPLRPCAVIDAKRILDEATAESRQDLGATSGAGSLALLDCGECAAQSENTKQGSYTHDGPCDGTAPMQHLRSANALRNEPSIPL